MTSTGIKTATRARMAETGENYTTALREVQLDADLAECGRLAYGSQAEGRILWHSPVIQDPYARNGLRGARYSWADPQVLSKRPSMALCPCGWAPWLGEHYSDHPDAHTHAAWIFDDEGREWTKIKDEAGRAAAYRASPELFARPGEDGDIAFEIHSPGQKPIMFSMDGYDLLEAIEKHHKSGARAESSPTEDEPGLVLDGNLLTITCDAVSMSVPAMGDEECLHHELFWFDDLEAGYKWALENDDMLSQP
jgi:hypothetical protein